MKNKYDNVDILIIGAGPAGLSAAITAKSCNPDIDICVIEKSAAIGNHNLSGAALEKECIDLLLNFVDKNKQENMLKDILLSRKVEKDSTLFLLGKKITFSITPLLKIAKALKVGIGNLIHDEDYIVSISALTRWLSKIAENMGVEILCGFAAEDILVDAENSTTKIKLVDHGIDSNGNKQPNYLKGEEITANLIILAEGCDGFVTEKFIKKVNLKRQANQLYSIGIKEVIRVNDCQYKAFGNNTVIHAMGYPLWRPVLGPAIFGGGFAYSMGENKIAVGMIAGLDWKECDFNPQDALVHFKNTHVMSQYLDGGHIIEAGAKMIPEAGFYALPMDVKNMAIGKANTIILGDSAGLVNMLKIKGLHNAIVSGIAAGKAVKEALVKNDEFAIKYTSELKTLGIFDEMKTGRNFRQIVAKLGNLFGMPLSVLGGLLPNFKIETDYESMTSKKYRYKGNKEYDKDTFTALANTEHREDQPTHLLIKDQKKCLLCEEKFSSPCITFCPAGVYEKIHGTLKSANAINCLHCKTCQRKCPLDNIRWVSPEGGGGPKYKEM